MFSDILNRIGAHWKTTLQGGLEAMIYPAAGAAMEDPKALKLSIALGILRFITGALSRDPSK